MLFRSILIAMCAGAWALALAIAAHESSEPVVLGRYSAGYFAVVLASFAGAAALTAANFDPLYRILFRARAGLALALVSAAGSLALAEVAVRIADPIGISYYEESRRYHLDKIADDELIFRHPPHMDAEYQGVRVRTNELGFRDRPVGPKAPDELRLMMLGDSVTFGWGVEAGDGFPRLLEDLLARRLQRPVRAINTAVGGYNSEQELAVARRHAGPLEPDALVLLYLTNDIELAERPFDPWRQVSLRGKSPPEIARLLIWHSWIYRLARHSWDYAREQVGTMPDAAGAGWQRSMAAIDQLGLLAESRDLPLFVFFRRYQPTPTSDRLLEDLARIAERRGFTLVDTVDWFAGEDRRRYMLSVVDVHPNAAGHRRIAEGMASVLGDALPLAGSRAQAIE